MSVTSTFAEYGKNPSFLKNPIFTYAAELQVEAIKSGVNPGLTMVVGPPGTGKTDTAVQIMHVLYHNFPDQRTLLIAHSNQVPAAASGSGSQGLGSTCIQGYLGGASAEQITMLQECVLLLLPLLLLLLCADKLVSTTREGLQGCVACMCSSVRWPGPVHGSTRHGSVPQNP